jgi:hypothetical protein
LPQNRNLRQNPNNCGHTQHPSGPEGWQLGSHVISSVYLQPARYFPDSIGFSGEVWRQSTARLPRCGSGE